MYLFFLRYNEIPYMVLKYKENILPFYINYSFHIFQILINVKIQVSTFVKKTNVYTHKGVKCFCPKGYNGDGDKDGQGCIRGQSLVLKLLQVRTSP